MVSDRPHPPLPPSPWIVRFADLIPRGAAVLDLAAGDGRHTLFLLERGHPVVALDRKTGALATLARPGLEILTADLEDGSPWPLPERRFGGVVVTNYLHRPLMPTIVAAVAPGGALLYETFAAGNEKFGKPSRPEFLLQPGELLETVRGRLRVVAYEDVELTVPKPSKVQRVAAIAA
jgi:SAM-dependent methyltransferase